MWGRSAYGRAGWKGARIDWAVGGNPHDRGTHTRITRHWQPRFNGGSGRCRPGRGSGLRMWRYCGGHCRFDRQRSSGRTRRGWDWNDGNRGLLSRGGGRLLFLVQRLVDNGGAVGGNVLLRRRGICRRRGNDGDVVIGADPRCRCDNGKTDSNGIQAFRGNHRNCTFYRAGRI